MSDKTVTIANFRYGLDTRRESLASLPGTLQACQNASIDAGGQINKRKAFVKDATLFPLRTFGLQDTDSGLMTFGDQASGAVGALPTGIVYQQLAYPSSPAPGQMTGVLFSCSFLGKPFVLATFDNTNDVFAYYNGSLVAQITDGIVKPSPGGGGVPETPSNLSSDLIVMVNRISGWLAHANVTSAQASDSSGYHETALAGSTLLMSPPGVHFTPTVSNNNSVAGLLGVKLLDQNYAGVGAVAASTAFVLNAGNSGTVDVMAPEQASTQTPQFDLTGGTVAYNTSLGQTALDVAAAINNNTFITGYSALGNAGTATVTVYAPTSFGAFTLNLVVTTTGTLTTTGGTVGSQFGLTLTPASIDAFVNGADAFQSYAVSAAVTASVKGTNVAPASITYTWKLLSGGLVDVTGGTAVMYYVTSSNANIGSGLNPVNVVGPVCTFVFQAPAGFDVKAVMQCTAHDGASADVTTTFTVKLSINKV